MQTLIFKMSDDSIDYKGLSEGANIIKKGGIVAFPTETVYGLAADMNNRKALSRLYELKQRPVNKPFTIHIGTFHKIDDFTSDKSTAIYKLIDKFWPGPLTLVLKGKNRSQVVGLRCPANKIAQELINRAIGTIVATSANLTTQEPAIDSKEVLANFEGKLEAIIDAGKTSLAIESSIVDLSGAGPKFLRIAAIKKEEIQEVLDTKSVLFVCTGNSCRSVMAKALLEKRLRELGRKGIEVNSAGTGTIGGLAASEPTIELLRNEGIDVSKHSSVSLSRGMIRKADLILAMAKIHEEQILALEPEAKKRLYLLREFANMKEHTNTDIVDPIAKPMEVYRDCFNIIKESVERVSKLL